MSNKNGDLERVIKEYVATHPAEWEALVGPNRSVDEYLDDYSYIEDVRLRLCWDLGIDPEQV